MTRLTGLNDCYELRQDPKSDSCVYLTVRWLILHGLIHERKSPKWPCFNRKSFDALEAYHQGGNYHCVRSHFTLKGCATNQCIDCYQGDLAGKLEILDFNDRVPFQDAKKLILDQILNNLPVVFTIQVGFDQKILFHSNAVVDADIDYITYIDPFTPAEVKKDWTWLEGSWKESINGGRALAWYVHP